MTPENVLEFWFGSDPKAPLAKAPSWFKKDAAFDRQIKDTFEGLLEQAKKGELDEWRTTSRGLLAFIVLLDQFSRNMYRDTPATFAQDPLALEASMEGQRLGLDRELTTIERQFFYLPMMHAEDLAMQRRCIEAYERLLESAPDDVRAFTANALDFGKRHLVIVERFGRFPHRNKILGRESTPAEIEFLAQPGSSF